LRSVPNPPTIYLHLHDRLSRHKNYKELYETVHSVIGSACSPFSIDFLVETSNQSNRELQIEVQFLNLKRQTAVRVLRFDVWRENEKVPEIDVYCNCRSGPQATDNWLRIVCEIAKIQKGNKRRAKLYFIMIISHWNPGDLSAVFIYYLVHIILR
jgi:hypothetical protein